jgi:hypothetical protein
MNITELPNAPSDCQLLKFWPWKLPRAGSGNRTGCRAGVEILPAAAVLHQVRVGLERVPLLVFRRDQRIRDRAELRSASAPVASTCCSVFLVPGQLYEP